MLGQTVSRSEERLLDLLGGERERVSDLAHAETLNLTQQVGAPLAFWQGAKGGDERSSRGRDLLRILRSVVLVRELDVLAPPAQDLDGSVLSDPVEPGPDVQRLAPAAQGLVRIEERDLGDVFAGRLIAEQARRVGSQRAGVPPVELVERCRVSGAE